MHVPVRIDRTGTFCRCSPSVGRPAMPAEPQRSQRPSAWVEQPELPVIQGRGERAREAHDMSARPGFLLQALRRLCLAILQWSVALHEALCIGLRRLLRSSKSFTAVAAAAPTTLSLVLAQGCKDASELRQLASLCVW